MYFMSIDLYLLKNVAWIVDRLKLLLIKDPVLETRKTFLLPGWSCDLVLLWIPTKFTEFKNNKITLTVIYKEFLILYKE